ncbi:MAG: S8 family serine peptidase [Acidimicrobiia bacterium]|nr:S8 family serine peptidase [Acidimicrobiia bacterium]
MALIGANRDTFERATGDGVLVGVLDTGIDFDHPDLAANINAELSCSFIFDHDPFALPVEIANGDCSNKAAVQDYNDHGTHVATTIAAPINGIGIAGVAPEATIVGLKVCSAHGFCFHDSVAAALRYAGDVGLDVVNLSLYADPYLYYCLNDMDQRAMYNEMLEAARYARQQGVLIVTSAGNGQQNLRHPVIDDSSPDYPEDAAVLRDVGNQCRVAPAEFPGAVSVMSTGPIGYEGYGLNIADYSTVGGDVAAPGGDYFQATGTVQDAILAGASGTSDEVEGIWTTFDSFGIPGLTSTQAGGRYIYLNGTSMASPHVAGVAALIIEQHPKWGPDAVAAALKRTANEQPCPADWAPLSEADERDTCRGGKGHNDFFGHGLVDAAAATR